MSNFSRVPVVDVHSDNLREVWPSMILAMSNAAFIGLDTELSGLGHRKRLVAKSIEDRYSNICEIARSRSILSLGVSCFQEMPHRQSNQSDPSLEPSSQSGSSYIVQTFNIMLLCDQEFMVEPLSLRFLVQHGFDFNKQFEKGIPYYRGDDRADDKSIQTVRHLFAELVSMKKPVVLHNGLVDLMFMYENLYTSLPPSSTMFLADLVDMFPNGIIDTKYIIDYTHLMQASYLEYVFRKCQKDNEVKSGKCSVHFPHYPAGYSHVTYRNCNIKPRYNVEQNLEGYRAALCETYPGHGWCPKEGFCQKSHDIDLIIDIDDYMASRKNRKRKRRRMNQVVKSSESTATSDNDVMEAEESFHERSDESREDNSIIVDNNESNSKGDNSDLSEGSIRNGDVSEKLSSGDILKMLKSIKGTGNTHANGGHRAGYDAFMTGFIYAVLRTKGHNWEDRTEEWKNKLYLGGKDYPLSVCKSGFCKQSKQHLEKIHRVRHTVV